MVKEEIQYLENLLSRSKELCKNRNQDNVRLNGRPKEKQCLERSEEEDQRETFRSPLFLHHLNESSIFLFLFFVSSKKNLILIRKIFFLFEVCPLTLQSLHQGSISPTFYEQLLPTQIPKAQKRQSTQGAFCAFAICRRKSCA